MDDSLSWKFLFNKFIRLIKIKWWKYIKNKTLDVENAPDYTDFVNLMEECGFNNTEKDTINILCPGTGGRYISIKGTPQLDRKS